MWAKPLLVRVRKHPQQHPLCEPHKGRTGGIHSNTPGESVEQQHTEHRENRRSRMEEQKLEGELPHFFLPLSRLLCLDFSEVVLVFFLHYR